MARVVERRTCRKTGTVVTLIDNRDGEFEAHDVPEWYSDEERAETIRGLMWATTCDDHGTYVMHATRPGARAFLSHPEEMCDECRAIVEEREDA